MKKLTPDQEMQVKNFVNACNGFIKGKFILTDIKIANILKSIAESELIYNLLAEYMINFNYEQEFKRCCVKAGVDSGSFGLPKDDNLIIPLVFCLLVQVDSKRIDFNYFLRTQFPYAENQNEQYDKFAQDVIVPFRNSIANKFNVSTADDEKKPEKPVQNIIDRRIEQRGGLFAPQPEIDLKKEVEGETKVEEPTQEQPEAKPVQQPSSNAFDKFVEKVKNTANNMLQDLGYVRKLDRSDNIRLVLQSLIKACEIKDMDIINGLIVALIEIAQKERVMRENLDVIKLAYADFLEQENF